MSDEKYIIDLCDRELGRQALRQHRFDFLVGDSGRRLPVDAYYPDLHLVVEYHERQHLEEVRFFDRRETVSGVNRGLQRRLYDQRRIEVLPQHGITVVVLSIAEFKHNASRRLCRGPWDMAVIRARLTRWSEASPADQVPELPTSVIDSTPTQAKPMRARGHDRAGEFEINRCIQGKLREMGLQSVSAVDAAQWLDRAGLLKDRPDRAGAPLRIMLRNGRIRGAEQTDSRWHIHRVSHFEDIAHDQE